jgi:hypothetical protein
MKNLIEFFCSYLFIYSFSFKFFVWTDIYSFLSSHGQVMCFDTESRNTNRINLTEAFNFCIHCGFKEGIICMMLTDYVKCILSKATPF